MMKRTALNSALVKRTHNRLRRLVREVGVLCRRALADDAFYRAFLEHVAAALDAAGGAIWMLNDDRDAVCRWQLPSPQSAVNSALAIKQRRPLIRRAAQSRQGLVYRLPYDKPDTRAMRAVYMPLRRGTRVVAVIEIFKITADAAQTASWLRFLQRMALLAVERPAPTVAPVPRPSASAKHVLSLIRAVHQSLDVEQSAYTIVNELRRLLACDRVSLIRIGGARPRMLAISGQDTFDRRADVVRQLTSVAASGEHAADAVWIERGNPVAGEPPPALPAGAEGISKWQTLGVVPLRPKTNSKPIGVIVIERMAAADAPRDLAQRTNIVLPHLTAALHNALEHSGSPLRASLNAGGRILRSEGAQWKRRVIAIALLAAAILFLATFPVQFQVHGRGTLQASVERDVFAEVDGIVRTVHVEHGDQVQAGDVLVELHNSDLELQLAQVAGDERTARERLAAVQRQRHDPRTPRSEHDRLASESLQLQESLQGLNEQFTLLQAKRERLVVRSPIAGQVTTWNVRKLLDQRPVAVGQVLVTVADPASPRELEIFLPESDIAHLSGAQSSAGQPLAVEYLVVTEPTVEHRGSLRQIDARAELHEEHDHSVRLLVDIDRSDAPHAPAGTTVTARIACGQRPIGYVWLHRLIGFVYTRILFHVT